MGKPRKTYRKMTSKGEKTISTTKWQKLVSKFGIKGAKKHYRGYKQVPTPPTTTGNIRSVKGGTRRIKGNKVGGGRRSMLYYKGDKVGTWTRSKGNRTKGRTGRSWYMERGYGTARKPVPDTPTARRLGIANAGKKEAESFDAESRFDKLAHKIARQYRKKGMSAKRAREIGRKTAAKIGYKKYGKAGMKRLARRGRRSAEDYEANSILVAGGIPGLNREEEWEMKYREDRGMPFQGEENMEEEIEELDVRDAELTMWQEAVKEHGIPPKTRSKGHGHPAHKAYRGRRQEDGIMYHYGDKVSRWQRSKGYDTKGINTGRGWFMERGYGTARKPVPDTPLTRKLGIANAGKQLRGIGGVFGKIKRMLVPAAGRVGFGINSRQDWEMNYFNKRNLTPFQADELTMWQEAVKEHGIPPKTRSKGHGHPAHKAYRGRRQEDGIMYHYGDKVSRWTPEEGYDTKGINTGRGWFMERGYGTARKPVPDTELTRELGIANAGRQIRGPGGRFGGVKRMLVPAAGDVGFGLNSRQDWEMNYFNQRDGIPMFQAQDFE